MPKKCNLPQRPNINVFFKKNLNGVALKGGLWSEKNFKKTLILALEVIVQTTRGHSFYRTIFPFLNHCLLFQDLHVCIFFPRKAKKKYLFQFFNVC